MKPEIDRSHLGLLVCIIFLAGCSLIQAPDHFTPQQKTEYTTLETLKSAKAFKVFALESAGKIYKQGLMDDGTKDKIISLGDDLQTAINTAADALIMYKQYGDAAHKQSLGEKIAVYQAMFNRFMEIVTPYLVKEV